MAQTDAAVFIPATGYVLTNVVDTAKPTATALGTFATAGTLPTGGWTALGHTDLDNILTFGSEGGDTTIKGSWQASALREITANAAVDHFTIRALQVLDRAVLSLAYGGGDATTAGEFDVPDKATLTNKAVTVVMVDGDVVVGLYSPKCSIRRDGDFEFSRDDFIKVPLRFTPLKSGTKALTTWYSAGLV